MITVLTPDAIVDRLCWQPSTPGHDATCWRRHPACAEEYVSQLQALVVLLDGQVRRLATAADLERTVERAVQQELAKRPPEVIERTVVVEGTDPRRQAVIDAASEWASAMAQYEYIRDLYDLDDRVSGMVPIPEDVKRAARRCERAEQVLEQAVQGLEELEPVVTADATS